jgi:hypothetical protein
MGGSAVAGESMEPAILSRRARRERLALGAVPTRRARFLRPGMS